VRTFGEKLFGLAALAGAFFLLPTLSTPASNVTLAWSASPSPGVAGYSVYYGTQKATYSTELNPGLGLSVTISNLEPGVTYYFAVKCHNALGDESTYSNEIAYVVPLPPLTLQISVSRQRQVTLTGTGRPGASYLVLAKGNSTNWAVIGAVTAGSSGSFRFVDPAGATQGRCLYRLRITPAPLNPPSLQIRVSPQKQVTLTGTGQPSDMYLVLAKHGSAPWAAIGATVANSNGAFQFIDTAGTTQGICLYRLRLAPPSSDLPTLHISISPQKQVILTGVGQPGATYLVLARGSSNNWTVIGTVTAGSDGSIWFVDPAGAGSATEFYQLAPAG